MSEPEQASGAAANAPTLDSAATRDPGGPVCAVVLGAGRSFGEFFLLEEVARGGMGVVFRAMQQRPHRIVALKMILAGHLASPDQLRRFRVEAEDAGQLDHPNIVPIYHVGEHEGQQFFTMKLVEGGNLTEKVAELVQSPAGAAAVVAAVARAVHHAHQRGILHRDIKPGNILLQAIPEGATHDSAGGGCAFPSGQFVPMVTDFGLAKHLGSDSDTRSGAVMGTPAYMSPEQAGGRKDLTTAADIYSLGAVLFELVTGRPPFQAESPLDTLLQVAEREPPRPRSLNPRVDRDLETIIMRCLEKTPARRFPTAEAVAEDLDRYRRGEPIRARPAGRIEKLAKWARRRPTAAALVAVSVLAAAGLATGGWWHFVQMRTALTQAQDARAEAQTNLVTAEAARTAAQAAAARLEASSRQRLDDFDSLLMRFDGRLVGSDAIRREFLGEIIQLTTAALADRPDDVPTRRKLGRLYQRLGKLEYDAENYADGEEAYGKSLEIQKALADAPAALSPDRSAVVYTECLHGLLLGDAKRLPEAEAVLRDAANRADHLAADHPEDSLPKASAYYACYRLADILERAGRSDEAIILYGKALAGQRTLAAAFPTKTDYRQYAAQTATALAALREGAKPDESQDLLEQVVRDEALAAKAAPGGTTLRPLGNAFSDLGTFLNRRGRHAGLLRLAEEIVAALPDDAGEVYNAACYAANAADVAARARDLPETERAKVADAYARRSVELLRRAAQCGYTNRDHMAEDPDLDPLRERPDFRAFWGELDHKNPGQPLTPARLVAGYQRQYQADLAAYQSRLRRAQTAAERRLVEQSKPKASDFAPRFLKFAADHGSDPAAVTALAWILESVEAGGAGTEFRAKALASLEREHLNKPNLADICEQLAQTPSPECDKLLRAVTEKHSSPDVRGIAALALAGSLGKQAQDAYKSNPSLSAGCFAEADRLYELVQKEYPAVVYSQSTLGETARAKLHELRHLSVGRPAQEIEGPDLNGKPMKLSDYRGKVVVLDFWANWCGYCRKMYRHEKSMVKKYTDEPFALVGVNADDDLAETRREVQRQGINWRSWRDRGPGGREYTQAWGVDGFPMVFVLDHTGVIRHRFDGFVPSAVLEAAVVELLAEANAAKSGK